MNTEITSKLAAFAVALMMNCLIMGAVALAAAAVQAAVAPSVHGAA
jgi:hypothetical protein